MNHVAMLVRKNLKFHMARRRQRFFKKKILISKCLVRFVPRGFQRLMELRRFIDKTHSLAATTC
jgi:hypothetical protein